MYTNVLYTAIHWEFIFMSLLFFKYYRAELVHTFPVKDLYTWDILVKIIALNYNTIKRKSEVVSCNVVYYIRRRSTFFCCCWKFTLN